MWVSQGNRKRDMKKGNSASVFQSLALVSESLCCLIQSYWITISKTFAVIKLPLYLKLCSLTSCIHSWWLHFLLLRGNWNHQLGEFLWYFAIKSPNLPSPFVFRRPAVLSIRIPCFLRNCLLSILFSQLYVQDHLSQNNCSCRHRCMFKSLVLNNKYKVKISPSRCYLFCFLLLNCGWGL